MSKPIQLIICAMPLRLTWLVCDPSSYTGGRWLHRDELERASRFIDFSFSELCKTVVNLFPKAKKIENCTKKEGGFNRVFILTLDSGHCVVARLPTTIAGPPRLATNSEVATMEYCMLPRFISNECSADSISLQYELKPLSPFQKFWPGMMIH